MHGIKSRTGMSTIEGLIHQHGVYSVSVRYEETVDDAEENFYITTHADRELVTNLDITTAGEWWIDIYEDATITDAGTALIAYDLDRERGRTIGATFGHTGTYAGGTLIYSNVQGARRAGSGKSEISFFHLKSDSNYRILLTNNSGAAASAGIHIVAFEHPSGQAN